MKVQLWIRPNSSCAWAPLFDLYPMDRSPPLPVLALKSAWSTLSPYGSLPPPFCGRGSHVTFSLTSCIASFVFVSLCHPASGSLVASPAPVKSHFLPHHLHQAPYKEVTFAPHPVSGPLYLVSLTTNISFLKVTCLSIENSQPHVFFLGL